MAKTMEKKKKKAEQGPRRFKLLPNAGPHFEPNLDFDPTMPEDEDDNIRDVEYVAGEIVESTRPLDKLFVNKFQRLGADDDEESSPAPKAGGQVPLDPENDPDKDRPVRTTEDATRRTSGRFLEEDELEGKPEELKKLARGEGAKKKSVLDDDEDEDERTSPNEVVDDEEDEEVEEKPARKTRKKTRK